ncbi:hypothetical protein [Candidatus Nitrosocosmicus arcticus]|uniref:Uncharacterized protein n=1 Tax=Candidatus Nitrosocosmicus arcticus TaxID=2035267 RepID=A0A557SVT0_9ARCH|nr:hypothetical protein [Candidatus Nitrosocosmicus arcticus]TVP40717.1 hypothetical protein NARC_60104 [Candidatus Nitrosocosmicus arcticus]
MTTIEFDVLDKLDKDLYEDMSIAFKERFEERTIPFHKRFEENERTVRGFDNPAKVDHFLNVTVLIIMERIAREQKEDLETVQRFFKDSFHPYG